MSGRPTTSKDDNEITIVAMIKEIAYTDDAEIILRGLVKRIKYTAGNISDEMKNGKVYDKNANVIKQIVEIIVDKLREN